MHVKTDSKDQKNVSSSSAWEPPDLSAGKCAQILYKSKYSEPLGPQNILIHYFGS